MQALREAVALRTARAARPDLTPDEAARLVQAVRARTAATPSSRAGAPRTAGAGRPARRRPVTGTGARRKPTAGPVPAARTSARAPWAHRLGVVALSTLLLPAVVALVLPGTSREDQDGQLDAGSLALAAQSSLMAQADRYHQLDEIVTEREAELAAAGDAAATAGLQLHLEQAGIGAAAAALYRAAPEVRFPGLTLDVRDAAGTSEALRGQAVAENVERRLTSSVFRSERSARTHATAQSRLASAERLLATARGQQESVLAEVRTEVGALGPTVIGQLAALADPSSAGAQQDRDQQALARWQSYLGGLADAGVVPPSAAALDDPADFPTGYSPALDAGGAPIAGVAWAVVGNRPVTVLPAETIAAVSAALSQLGKPYVPGATGPDTYGCGGFVTASWLLAGYAVPSSPAAQWDTGTPVPPADLQVGDLVISPSGADTGIYLGEGEVIGASAISYQVGVSSVAPGSVSIRVPLGPADSPPAPLAGPAVSGECGAPMPVAGPVNPAWGGWANGQIPGEMLCALGAGRHALRCDAADAYDRMSRAFAVQFGQPLCITDSYRSLPSQVSAFARKPRLAAVPGTSNHGWALAVDLCAGVNRAYSPQWNWMTEHAGRFGWVQADWARPDGEKPEPWHWEFGIIS